MRNLVWLADTLDRISALPSEVKKAFGFALREAQRGETPIGAVALARFGTGVFELRQAFRGDAYRSVYAVKMRSAVYVLHVFKKKSKSGKAIPREDVQLIAARFRQAQIMDATGEQS
ncbi:MAG: type II toxin-antitoxin system RelE/ParE family toxin [Rhodospirillaceae bacterium]|nr:type II toxin-antitoxin system RelE/ParE family toxin [Rhodospirillaceae bacterium]